MNKGNGKASSEVERYVNTIEDDLKVAYREIALLQEQIAFDDLIFPQVEDLEDQ